MCSPLTHSLTHTRAIQQFSVNTNAKKKRKNETKLRRNQLTCALEMPVALVLVLLFLSSLPSLLLVSMHACACMCGISMGPRGAPGMSKNKLFNWLLFAERHLFINLICLRQKLWQRSLTYSSLSLSLSCFANLVNLLHKLWSVRRKSKIMPEKPIRAANTD